MGIAALLNGLNMFPESTSLPTLDHSDAVLH